MRGIRVLGLSLGTRTIGMVTAELNCVFYTQMKLFKDSWSEKKLQAILSAIDQYITKRNIKHIALKIPPHYSHSPAIVQLLTGIESLAKAKQVELHIFTLHNITQAWTEAEKTRVNKRQLVKIILEKYNLYHVYKKQANNKAGHYDKIFEAVGAADIVLRKLNNK